MGFGCTQKMINSNVSPNRQQQQFNADRTECLAYAYGQIPAQQVHINSKGSTSYSGNLTGFDNRGNILSGQHKSYSQNNNPAAYWADMANMTSSLSATLTRDRLLWQCMAAKGWQKQSKEHERFWKELNKEKPDWVNIGKNPNFMVWLVENDNKKKYFDAMEAYDSRSVILLMECWEYETAQINKEIGSIEFDKWIKDQPQYFQKIAKSGLYYKKKALLEHYRVVTKHEGVYSVPQNPGLKLMGIWGTGMKAFVTEKDYEKAFYFLGGLAAWGSRSDWPLYFSDASMALSALKKNDRAFLWEMKAAEKGIAEAQGYIGMSYLLGGRMVDKNEDMAFKYLLFSAEQGNTFGQASLSQYYAVKMNKEHNEKIFYYSLLSALQGDSKGQKLHSLCHEHGVFTPKNYYKAYKWACIAKANGNSDVDKNIKNIEKVLTKQDISKAQLEAENYIQEFRKNGADKKRIVILFQPLLNTYHVSCTSIPPLQYAEIMSAIHASKSFSYKPYMLVESDSSKLYYYIKQVLKDFEVGPVKYKVEEKVLKDKLKHLLAREKTIVFSIDS